MLDKIYGISKHPDIGPNILQPIFLLTVDTLGLHCTHQAISVVVFRPGASGGLIVDVVLGRGRSSFTS